METRSIVAVIRSSPDPSIAQSRAEWIRAASKATGRSLVGPFVEAR